MKNLQQAVRENAEINVREETTHWLDYLEKAAPFMPIAVPAEYAARHRKP